MEYKEYVDRLFSEFTSFADVVEHVGLNKDPSERIEMCDILLGRANGSCDVALLETEIDFAEFELDRNFSRKEYPLVSYFNSQRFVA